MTVRILVQSTHMKISYAEATESEIIKAEHILNSKFRAEDTTWIVGRGGQRIGKNEIKSFYIKDNEDPKKSKNLLTTGFLFWLLQYFNEAEFSYEVDDQRKFPSVDKIFAKKLIENKCSWVGKDKVNYIPRDYQIKATMKAVHKRGGIISAPTGSGKGFVIALLARMYSKHKILCLFDQIGLVTQTRDAFVNKYGFNESEIGVIQGQNFQDDRRITLLSVASYEKAAHIFPEQKILIIDEAHGLASGTTTEMATRVLYSCQNAAIRIGLTATAKNIDNPYRQMALYGNLGPIIFDEHIQEKIAEGALADVDLRLYNVNGLIPVTGNWADSYDEVMIKSKKQLERAEKAGLEIITKNEKQYARQLKARGDESTHYVFNDVRNNLIAKLALENKHVAILFTRREHGERLLKVIEEKGGNAKLIHGLDKIAVREEAKEFLLEDKKNIVLASNIWKKGEDIQWIHTLIIAGGGKGTVMTIQRFGRATRIHKGTNKVKAKVIDFLDNFSPLGIKQSTRRKNIYQDELGFKVKII